ncbi:CoA ester lyase, partial [bacterium]|nr:CoA ester lyase [bacterium]
MSAENDNLSILRSLLFVPGHIEKMLLRAAEIEADGIVLDLEDAVPAGQKETARHCVRNALKENNYKSKTVFIRVNPFESGLTRDDITAFSELPFDGFVYANTNDVEDIEKLNREIQQIEILGRRKRGTYRIIPILESPRGILNANRICDCSPRIVAVIFGCEDYLAEQEGRHSPGEEALLAPRTQVAMAAHAAGIQPIDTPFVRVQDLRNLRSFAEIGLTLGMSGMCALTPDQVTVINDVYTPNDEEIRNATLIVGAAESCAAQNRGVCVVDGRFISPPT